jgi:hypothetical protein
MVDTGIFATTAEVQRKAGARASTVSNVEAYINQFMTEAESYINTVCHYNFSDGYAALNTDTKGILKKWASALAAMNVISYDMSGFTSRTEAQTMLNVLWNEAQNCERLLSQKTNTDWIRGA